MIIKRLLVTVNKVNYRNGEPSFNAPKKSASKVNETTPNPLLGSNDNQVLSITDKL